MAVTITELNQQTAKVLERIKQGESIDVTERGRPIARIVPITPGASALDDLVREGRALAATRPDVLLSHVPAAAPGATSLTETLARDRDEER